MKICSYHSNLYFPEFKFHVQEMKDHGFDTILFCISEQDMLYNLVIFKEFRSYAESKGMQSWATFWGYNAGEAVVSGKYKSSVFYHRVDDIGFKNFLIDEPKITSVLDFNLFIDENKIEFPDVDFHLCLSDDVFNKLTDEEIKNMPVKSLGVSCYMLGHTAWNKHYIRAVAIIERLYKLRPKDNFVFIQGFGLPEGYENMPMDLKVICKDNYITSFGFWSFRATITGTKRSANPELIWSKIKF